MPLVDVLLKRAPLAYDGWHMPGHFAGAGFSQSFQQHFALFDTTELSSTDDINHPAGPALIAMEKAARAFGAGYTRFITIGSTGAIQILLAAAAGAGGQVLIPRWTHQAVMHAAAVQKLNIRFIQSQRKNAGFTYPYLFPQLTPSDIRQAIIENPDCRAVLLTSPDYYGCCYDIRTIADICHQAGVLLLVDEAHGAHLAFHAQTRPLTAMAAGADACVQSGHKTLPVLTQGAYLHLSEEAIASGRLNAVDVDRLIPMVQTSSPSFLIAASLDYARAIMEKEGARLIDQQLAWLSDWIGCLSPVLSTASALWQKKKSKTVVKTINDSKMVDDNRLFTDPLRLVLVSGHENEVIHGLFWQRQLQQSGTEIELADLTRLVLIPSLFQTGQNWQKLSERLHSLAETKAAVISQSEQTLLKSLEADWQQAMTQLPDSVLTVDKAVFGQYPIREVLLADAGEQVSGCAVTPYPPGIPLIWPGEKIEKRHLDLIKRLLENGISISGIKNKKIDVLNV